MKPSKFLREAAIKQWKNNRWMGGCGALHYNRSKHEEIYQEAKKYFSLFSPSPFVELLDLYFWWARPSLASKEGRIARSLALCFAADIAESEGN